jgi:hypothetical protein
VWRGPNSTASTTARGYGRDHQRARKQAAQQHKPTDPCARCGHALGPMGTWLHYDHTDSRDDYLGFSHGSRPCPVCGRRCNIRAGAQKANRNSRRRVIRSAESLRW